LKHHISYFYNALVEQHLLHQAWCETQSSSSTEKNWESQHMFKCPSLAETQARKCAGQWSTVPSISDCSRLHHTAAGCAWFATSCKKIK